MTGKPQPMEATQARVEHTPGPWVVEDIAIGASGLMWMRVKADGHTLVTVEGESDARLIAEAPDLLAACEEIARLLKRTDDNEAINEACAIAFNAAYKARGEAQ